MLTHRLALCVSGAVALGSYEAGVLTRVYRDLQFFNQQMAARARLHIDAIAGSSAGSITGLILSQAVAFGWQPQDLEQKLRDCWLHKLDIETLLTPESGPSQSMFTQECVAAIARDCLNLSPQAIPGEETIALWITMTNLDGVPYAINFERPGYNQANTTLYARAYRDYEPYLIQGSQIRYVTTPIEKINSITWQSSDPGTTWADAKEAAVASSAFPLAFQSRLLNRNLAAYGNFQQFKAQLQRDPQQSPPVVLPEQATFEFVDGGILNNEPIGRAIDAVSYLEKLDSDRIPDGKTTFRTFLIVEPDPETPAQVAESLTAHPYPADPSFPGSPPGAVLGKMIGAYFNDALYSDFKQAEQTNKQIRGLNEVLEHLDTLLASKGVAEAERRDWQLRIKKAVGLDYKREITLERVPHTLPTRDRLAGAWAGHFGGFLRLDYREADFMTGQWEAHEWFKKWIEGWLRQTAAELGMTEDQVTESYIASLLDTPPQDPRTTPLGDAGLTPEQLTTAAWFPNKGADLIDIKAALNTDERDKIVTTAEHRLDGLLSRWFKIPELAIKTLFFVLGHTVKKKVIDDPNDEED